MNERLAFVLMPFRDEFTIIYESIVKPIVKNKGLDCKRADDYMTTRAVIQDIWWGICESLLVIADTTGLNHNVMYELGIAHAMGKRLSSSTNEKISQYPLTSHTLGESNTRIMQ